jgi:hypothetical protein
VPPRRPAAERQLAAALKQRQGLLGGIDRDGESDPDAS